MSYTDNYEPDVVKIYGDYLKKTKTPHHCENPMITCAGDDGERLDISEAQASKHVMVLGAIGTGKTNAFYYMIDSMSRKMDENDIMLIFDTKGDFKKEFYDDKTDYIIGNSAEYEDITYYWNVFREIEYGGSSRAEKELMAKEIAKVFFEDRKNSSQPFFSSAACDIFCKVLLSFMRQFWNQDVYRELEERLKQYPRNSEEAKDIIRTQREIFDQCAGYYNNKMLVENVLRTYERKDYVELLKQHKDFKSSLNYLGEKDTPQSLGVLAELSSMVNDCFLGVFAEYEEGRDISIREIVHEKGGRRLFIEYDLSIGEVLAPVYGILIDLGLKEALGRTRSEGNVFVFIDEYKLTPRLSHGDDAANFGRSLGIKMVIGLQTIAQLEDVYGETKGKVIAAGFSNIIAFRMADEISRKFVSERFGKNYLAVRYWNGSNDPKWTEREGYTVEDWQLMDLKVGEAIIGLSGYEEPFYFKFREWKK